MKKIVLIMGALFVSFICIAQNDKPFQSTEVCIDSLKKVRIESYDDNYCYFKRMENKPVYVGYDEILGKSVYSSPSRFCEKYANWTPGQLIAQSGKLKNTALTVGVVTCLSASALVGFSFLTENPIPMCAIGGVIGFGGGIATIAILATSNKLLQEAGLKMQRIQISANGLTVKF